MDPDEYEDDSWLDDCPEDGGMGWDHPGGGDFGGSDGGDFADDGDGARPWDVDFEPDEF
jgi:hypothetical protein